MQKRTSVIILGVLLLVFVFTSIKAVGTIPSSYSQDARDLLSMLWGKLDQVIISNYNVSMDLRYHDHQGSLANGSFKTKGLPLDGSKALQDFSVTESKLATGSVNSRMLDTCPITITVSAGTSSALDDPSDDCSDFGTLGYYQILGYYPAGNQDQFVDSIAINAEQVEVNLAGNAVADNVFTVVLLDIY